MFTVAYVVIAKETMGTRREQQRAETEAEIRARARALLVRDGPQAVTLRAIARELGLTAPALYRYFASREALVHALCEDVCADVAAALRAALGRADDDLGRLLAVCRAFRDWALGHPQEFVLTFATSDPDVEAFGCDAAGQAAESQISGVFLSVIAPLLTGEVLAAGTPVEAMSLGPELEDELRRARAPIVEALAAAGVTASAEAIGLESVYLVLQWWARLYGHVALEVFGRFPFGVTAADHLFDSLLAELAAATGLTPAASHSPAEDDQVQLVLPRVTRPATRVTGTESS